MERNALLAAAISLLILVLWNQFVLQQYAPPPVPIESGDPSTQPDVAVPLAAAPEVEPLAEAPNPAADDPPVVRGRDVIVETDLFRAVLTTAGARLRSLELKQYGAQAGSAEPQQLIFPASSVALPLGVLLRGTKGSVGDDEVLYEVDRERLALSGDQTGSLEFRGKAGAAEIVKRFTLRGNRYVWDLDVDVASPPSGYAELALTWDGELGEAAWGGGYAAQGSIPYDAVLALKSDKLERTTKADLEERVQNAQSPREAGVELNNEIDWVGFSGQYFFTGLVPLADEARAAAKVWISAPGAGAQYMLRFPGTRTASLAVYTGPKDLDLLDEAGHKMRRTLDLGWFTVVALPLLQALRLSNKVTGNYGVDIILLTILIKLLFYPLTKKSFESMKAMQKLQPEMEKIRERHKDKPEEMNKAVMELYRRHKVNPLGGCLPMLLQLPVFIGLYQALLNAVELRHAPFAGWITDLSAPDRLGSVQLPFVSGAGFPVLTLIMGASMILQQKMTPMTTADPMQQRMMMLMPVVFTFMFINFPAGLVLYWLINNILTIGQQYMINRQKD